MKKKKDFQEWAQHEEAKRCFKDEFGNQELKKQYKPNRPYPTMRRQRTLVS